MTPAFNSEKYIAETIESVISQKGEFEVEYIFMDNCSVDKTTEIVRNYQRMLEEGCYRLGCNGVSIRLISRKDDGMYDAINKGFEMATGDIFAWINTDDIYLPGAFDIVAKVFQKYPEIEWLKGITSYINESSTIYQTGKCFLYNRPWIEKGVYGREAYFIQQDSVFWRSVLWKSVGEIDVNLKLAGDYYLWKQFAKKTSLFTVKAYLSCFRKVKGQQSQHFEAYMRECEKINSSVGYGVKKIKKFFAYENRIPFSLRPFIYRMLFGNQKLNIVELVNGTEPVLKRVFYYLS